MIRRYWATTVGYDAPTDPNRIPQQDLPESTSKTGELYRTKLKTDSPPASDLPAKTATPEQLAASRTLDLDDLSSVEPMDIRELLVYAIANSRDYRSQREQLFIESLNLLRERHLWGPRFFNTLSTTLSGTPSSGDFDQALDVVNSFRATQRLYYGGEISATALVNFTTLVQEAATTTPDTQSASLTLSASIPLLRGAGWVAREDLIQSERDLIYAARTFERFRRTFLLDVATRYFDLLRQQATIDNQLRQLESFTWLADRIEALAEAGRQPTFEVQRAQQQVLFAENNLLNARETYQRQLDSFKLLIGMPIDEVLNVARIDLMIPEPVLATDESVKTALRNRLDLQTIRDRIDDAQRAVKVAKNDLQGDLNLDMDLTLNTDAGKDKAGVDVELSDSTYSIGLTYDAPLDRKTELIAYRTSLISLEQAHRNHQEQRDAIVQSVRSSIRQIQQSRFTLELQERNIAMSEKRLRGVVLRLRSLGPRDFIEAENDLLEAQNRVDSAVRDLRVSILQYLVDTGQMRVTPEGHWLPPAKLVPIEGNPPGTATPRKIVSDPQKLEETANEADNNSDTSGNSAKEPQE